MLQLGLDIGGSKIAALVLDEQGQSCYERRIATPADNYSTFLDAVCALVGECQQQLGTALSVGIGLPGAISPDSGLIKNSNCLILNGKDLKADLSQRLGLRVAIANDADCFTLSEATDGAGAGAKTVFGVIIGTGCGGGVVVNGQLLSGPNAIAGEWGHNPLPDYSPERDGEVAPCYCGRAHCIERFISGTGLAEGFARRYQPSQSAEPMSAEQIIAAMRAGNRDAMAHFSHFIDALARALGSIVNVLDPHVIVLGGGLSNVGEIYQQLPGVLPRYLFSDSCHTRVVAARYGDASGVRGAAWLGGKSAA